MTDLDVRQANQPLSVAALLHDLASPKSIARNRPAEHPEIIIAISRIEISPPGAESRKRGGSISLAYVARNLFDAEAWPSLRLRRRNGEVAWAAIAELSNLRAAQARRGG